MQIVICDDSAESRDDLRKRIRCYGSVVGLDYVIEEFESAEGLLAFVKQGNVYPDILFMDIYMGGMSGMDAAKALMAGGFKGAVIFTTSSESHAVQSYQIMADGYLVKPYLQKEFDHYFKRAVQGYTKSFKTVSFLCDRLEFRVFLKDLEFIETTERGSLIHAKGEILRTTKSVSEFLDDLEKEENFLQCHRACLINLNYVDKVEEDCVRMKNGARAPLALRNRQAVKKAVADYFFLKMREE